MICLPSAQFSAELGAADALAGVVEYVHGVDPLAKWNVGVLKDGASPHGELLLAAGAVVGVLVLDGAGDVVFAARALDAVGPAFSFKVIDRGLFVGKFLDKSEDVEVVRVVAVGGGMFGGYVIFSAGNYTGSTPKLQHEWFMKATKRRGNALRSGHFGVPDSGGPSCRPSLADDQ